MKYLVTPKSGNGFEVGYNDDGHINYLKHNRSFESSDKLDKFLEAIWQKSNLDRFVKTGHATLTEIAEDLSFERFWNEYNYKFGKKPSCKKVWQGMPDAEKAKALAHITKYNDQLKQSSRDRMYPQSYLNRAEWNN